MDVLRILLGAGLFTFTVGVITAAVNFYSVKRKSNVEDKDVAIQAIETAIPGLGEIVKQMREQVAWLSAENEKCLKVSAAQSVLITQQSIEIAGLKVRVAELERATNGTSKA